MHRIPALLLCAVLLPLTAAAQTMPSPEEKPEPRAPATTRAEIEARGLAPIEVAPEVTHAPFILLNGRVMTANGTTHAGNARRAAAAVAVSKSASARIRIASRAHFSETDLSVPFSSSPLKKND